MSLSSTLITSLGYIKMSHYTQVCSSCIIFFEHLITLDDEIGLIWPSPWTPGKVLFLLNRYYPLAAAIYNTYAVTAAKASDSVCLNYYHWQGWSGLVSYMLAEGILQLRLYSWYILDKRILCLMLTFFGLSITMAAFILATMLSKIAAMAITLPTGESFCIPLDLPPGFYMVWIPFLAFGCLICILALFRAFQTLGSGSLLFNGRMLAVILIRDSVLYFLVISAANSSSLLIWILAPVTLAEIPIGFPVAMSCVLGNRVLLNVRKARQPVLHIQRL